LNINLQTERIKVINEEKMKEWKKDKKKDVLDIHTRPQSEADKVTST
jgi:ferredoxin-fold anticodon binding domain-containing protein